MKVTELRIGNLVTIDSPRAYRELLNTPMHVTSIVQRLNKEALISVAPIGLDVGAGSIHPVDRLRAIPLSEEMLLKCGLEQLGSDDGYCTRWMLGRIVLSVHKDGRIALEQINGKSKLFSKDGFVHKLQNKYYEITDGEELEINLN